MASELQPNNALGDDIIGNRLSNKTKTQYKRKACHFTAWMEQNHEEHTTVTTLNGVESRKLVLESIDKNSMKEFFGHICKKKRNNEYTVPNEYQSFQHVSGYKSAIKNHYHLIPIYAMGQY